MVRSALFMILSAFAAGGQLATAVAQDAKKPPKEGKPAPSLKGGDPAPPLKVSKWLQGEPVKAFEPGKVYVVEFWATWCGPCIAFMPHLAELQAEYKDKSVTVIGFTARDVLGKPDHTEELVLVQHGESEQRPDDFELGAGMGVVGISLGVGDVNGLLGHRYPPGTGVRPWPVRVQALILDHFGCLAEVRPHAEDVAVGEIEEARIRPAEPRGRLDDLVENRLEPHPRGAQRAEDVCDRLLPAAEII